MEKLMKRFLAFFLIIALGGASYYWYILNSEGNQSIHYLEPHKDYASFNDLAQDPALKGKIIYVDVWRTTCHPCLIEFQSAAKFKKQLSHYQDKIAFVYLGADISVPGEEFRWKRMIERINLTGYHYFMNDAWFDRMWKDVIKDPTILPGFPQHFIVDRQGKVLDFNAPGITNKQLYYRLEALLKEKS